MNFPQYFKGLEAKLVGELLSIRATTSHNSNKGQKTEAALRTFLNDHLPRSLEVGQGEVVDRDGAQAGDKGGERQVDIIILSEDHPRLGVVAEPNTYFIEGVSAAGEVKTSFKLDQLDAAFAQAVEFKKLNARIGKYDSVMSNDSDIKRFVERRPYFLFAFESSSPISSVTDRLAELEEKTGVDSTSHFDAIFFLDRGAAFNVGDGNGAFMMLEPSGARITGWGFKEEGPLLSMIAWLSIVMHKIQRYSAIIAPYLTPPAPIK